MLYGALFLVVILLLPEGVIPRCSACGRASAPKREESGVRQSRRRRGEPARRPAARTRTAGREAMSMLEAEDVSKAFGGIQALNACCIRVEEGEITGLDRSQRLGQDDALQRHDRLRERRQRERRVCATRAITAHRRRTAYSGLGIGRTFQLTRIFPRLTVLENMHVAAQRKGFAACCGRWSASHERARVRSCSTSWASPA